MQAVQVRILISKKCYITLADLVSLAESALKSSDHCLFPAGAALHEDSQTWAFLFPATHLPRKLISSKSFVRALPRSAQAIKTIFHATLGSASQKSRPFKYELSVPQMGGSFKLFQIWFLQLAAQKLAIATNFTSLCSIHYYKCAAHGC